MRKVTKNEPIKDADEIIDQFTSQCDVVKASTIFTRLYVGYSQLYLTGKPMHSLDPCNQHPHDEEVITAFRAIGTLLYEIEKSMKVETTKQLS